MQKIGTTNDVRCRLLYDALLLINDLEIDQHQAKHADDAVGQNDGQEAERNSIYQPNECARKNDQHHGHAQVVGALRLPDAVHLGDESYAAEEGADVAGEFYPIVCCH